MANSPSSPEKGLTTIRSIESSKLVVRQPAKLAELTSLLETFDNLSQRVSETTGEDRSSDMGGGGGTAGAGTGGQTGQTARDIAIGKIPEPVLMRKQLESHIEKEMHTLEREAKAIMGSSVPGSAHKLNEIYARIRRLNALLNQIIEASLDLLRRLYIRVFIDSQPIL